MEGAVDGAKSWCNGEVVGGNYFLCRESFTFPSVLLFLRLTRTILFQSEVNYVPLGIKLTTILQQVPPAFNVEEVSSLPPSKDWSEEGVVNPIIPMQGPCGSCWSFAATGTIEAHLAIATGEEPMSLSEMNLLQCSPNPEECGGEHMMFAFVHSLSNDQCRNRAV